MNITEAIKSGKRFKRKDWPTFVDGNLGHRFTAEEIISDDWEIESLPVPITREQFNKACQSVLGRFASDHILVVCWLGLTKSERTITAVLTDLAKELGL